MAPIKLNSEAVKNQARKLGADLVGICSAKVLNENPPDPQIPQTPDRIWKECRSVIVIGKHLPWGIFRAQGRLARQFTPQMVLSRLDNISLDLAYFLEENGSHALPLPHSTTDTALKRGSYGSLSLRHLAVEAGLGTLGLNLFFMSPQYGPRVYLSAVLTDFELEPDTKQTKRLCLGTACGRCLMACPGDAVEHWAINKRKCARHAQQYGVGTLISYFDKVITAPTPEDKRDLAHDVELVDLWQAVRTGTAAYAGCPRCIEVCPVGEGYNEHLKEVHAHIEKTPEREEKLKLMRLAEQNGEVIQGMQASRRWIGE